MNTEIYRNFITIVEEGSLTAASKRIRIAQPALSNQIKTLEEKYGAQIVQMGRGIRRLKLTDAGRILYEKAKYLCELEDSTSREIRDLESGISGTLRIALSPSVSEHLVSQLLIHYYRTYPNVLFELHEVTAERITDLLLSGICDLGIVRASLQSPDLFRIYNMNSEKLTAVFSKNSQWISDLGPTISLHELDNIPLCVTQGWLRTIEKAFSEINTLPQIISISTTRLSSLIWAREGYGVALVPVDSLDSFDASLVSIQISGENLQTQKSMITVKDRYLPAVVRNFLVYCKEILQRDWIISDTLTP